MKPDSFWQASLGHTGFAETSAAMVGLISRCSPGGLGRNLPCNRHSCDGHHIVLLDQVISGTSVQLCCSGGYMPTLADIYEDQAEECLRAAAKADDPQRRALMLKLAHAWRKDAEALKRGEQLQPASPPRKARAFGRGAEGTPGPAPIQPRRNTV